MHNPNTICPRHTDGRGIKKEKEGEERGGAAEVSDFFYKESKSKKQRFFQVVGEGATRVSEWILLKKSKSEFYLGGGPRFSEFFLQRIQI